ncbi:M50 family metallopeptidase [Paenibacillus sp. LHD-117]|uniref:M50 family metallopeptidase n=1 Tax=Paenibacillus sp. LHD-117 TaxID=3071412 RepID=UPI0027E15E49|nr:M50 family metallopeptidase [Paenibacillus sp. LHD-117]MDQ6422650.1 M50 family metallopeptidase [Paenibacillus sp. LHD-117]
MVYVQIAIGAALAILVHELGHAFFQTIFRIPVHLIEWGSGPRLFKLGKFEMRLIPFSGGIQPNGVRLANAKWKGVLIALGGLIAQWFMVVVSAVIVVQLNLLRFEWIENIIVVFVVCAFLSFFNLIPYRGTDGYHLFRLFYKKTRKAAVNE